MKNQIKKWWNNYAKYYQETSCLSTDTVQYGPFSSDENELNLLGDVKGKKILELGCGGGQCSVALARQGAKCTAIDFSEEQLRYAGVLVKKHNVSINFVLANIQNFNKHINGKFDIVLSVFAFQFVSDIDTCFHNVNKVLKKNGTFIFSFDHPFYIITTKGGRVFRSYYDKKPILLSSQQVFNDKGGIKKNNSQLTMYTRKISDILMCLKNNGFELREMIEPNKYLSNDPWKEMYDKKLVELIAPTIIFSAKKIN